MALKRIEGFDHYKNTSDFVARTDWLQWTKAGLTGIEFTTGRNGNGKALTFPANSSGATATFADRNATIIVGFVMWASYQTDSGASPTIPIELIDSVSGTTQLTIQFNATNCSISIFRGSTLLYLSANNVWTLETWENVEIKATIDNAAGAVAIRINQVELVSLTGIDTQNSANAWVDQLFLAAGAEAVKYDDLYVCDATVGPGLYPCDDFLGDVRCFTMFPIGNNAVQFTALANANWQEVAETAMDSDTSYNYSATAGQEDTFNFAPLPGVLNNILAVQITGAYRKDDAGTRQLKQALISNVTESYGDLHNLPDGNYTYYTDLFVLDPDTAANWTLTRVNALAAGYHLQA